MVDGVITGGSGVDTIYLGSDGETVDGGGGLDQIYGGTGADTFAFSHDGATNAATIHGFNVANDTIELSHSLFTKLAIGATPTFAISKFATSASDHLFYNTTGGTLWYDSNGNAAGGVVEIANLGAGLKLTASNFTVV
jgi:Ca2+-binding RTX toxin-like protein